MKNVDQAPDESMEEILASIRKIIADDETAGAPRMDPLAPPRRPQGERALRQEPAFDLPPPPAPPAKAIAPAQLEAMPELDILDLTDDFLMEESGASEPSLSPQQLGEALEIFNGAPVMLDPALIADGERRLWDEQEPLRRVEPTLAPPPPAAAPARSAPAPQQAAPRLASSQSAPERSPGRAWSGREAPKAPPASVEAAWPRRDGDAWPASPQPAAPQAHFAAPFQGAAAPLAQVTQLSPSQPRQGGSRISAPVTHSGSPAGAMPPGGAFPGEEAASAISPMAESAPQYMEAMAEELARAAIGSLGDQELEKAGKLKLAQAPRPALAEAAASFAGAMMENAERPPPAKASFPHARPAPEAPSAESGQMVPPVLQPQGVSGSLEAGFRELLRPMLAEWLNENMPRLLDDAIKDEVKRRMGQD